MKFVIFHGSLGSSNGNWFPSLKEKLEYMGQTVYCPQYPVDLKENIPQEITEKTSQNLDRWTKHFENEVLPNLLGNEKICFIAHSLGNIFVLHLVEKYKIKLDCAIFVSPFLDLPSNITWPYNVVNSTFYRTDFDFSKLKKYIPVSYVLYSDTDPYVKPHVALHFATVLDSSHIMVRRAGHMNAAVNMNEFPLVYDLCVSRLDLTLYQKYSLRREVTDTVDILRHSDKKYIEMTKEHLDDEGTFHFMELSKGGFATFMSNSNDWNPEDEYFKDGRECVRKGLDITRVFVIVNKKDLKRKVLRKQMDLDIKAGIKVYIVDYEKYKEIGCEEDFGVWDNEYVCIQHRDNKGNVTDGLIDARVKTLLTAQNWRDRILRMAKRIKDVSDIM